MIDKRSTKAYKLEKENKKLKELCNKYEEKIEQIRDILYKRRLDDYDTYTANVVCDFQSDFEEILRGE